MRWAELASQTFSLNKFSDLFLASQDCIYGLYVNTELIFFGRDMWINFHICVYFILIFLKYIKIRIKISIKITSCINASDDINVCI